MLKLSQDFLWTLTSQIFLREAGRTNDIPFMTCPRVLCGGVVSSFVLNFRRLCVLFCSSLSFLSEFNNLLFVSYGNVRFWCSVLKKWVILKYRSVAGSSFCSFSIPSWIPIEILVSEILHNLNIKYTPWIVVTFMGAMAGERFFQSTVNQSYWRFKWIKGLIYLINIHQHYYFLGGF